MDRIPLRKTILLPGPIADRGPEAGMVQPPIMAAQEAMVPAVAEQAAEAGVPEVEIMVEAQVATVAALLQPPLTTC